MTHKYRLEPYGGRQTRYFCPQCGHRSRSFSRYMDMETGLHIHETVGRCSRADKCAYHLSPRQYFAANRPVVPISTKPWRHPLPARQKPVDCIPQQLFRQSLKAYQRNHLITYLMGLFSRQTVERLVARYYIGTARHWPGATVFWQVDVNGNIRTGKIMLYNAITGKRVKQPFNHIQWAHSLMRNAEGGVRNEGEMRSAECGMRNGNEMRNADGGMRNKGEMRNDKSNTSAIGIPPSSLPITSAIGIPPSAFCLKQCLFGEHLLSREPGKTIALVESEKTALLASVFMPQYLWMATGALGNLNTDLCRVLNGRTVMLFPDLNAAANWQQKAAEINKWLIDIEFVINDKQEESATDEERELGFDIADYLVRGWMRE